MASSLVNNKYRITRRIGGGSFGEIYMGIGPNNEKVRFQVYLYNFYCMVSWFVASLLGCSQVRTTRHKVSSAPARIQSISGTYQLPWLLLGTNCVTYHIEGSFLTDLLFCFRYITSEFKIITT